MNTPEESLNDPDYISTTSNDQAQQKIYEENARNTTAKKITAIVEREFLQEIDSKKQEILQIQERLHKALKTLHFLRYVIITNFYNRKQCLIPQAAETTKQTRIHPAIKSILGKGPKHARYCTDLAVPSTSTDPRFLPHTGESNPAFSHARTPPIGSEEAEAENDDTNGREGAKAEKRENVVPPDGDDSRPRKIPRYVPPKSSVPKANARPSRGERHKVCKRIIVGNISKWIPLDWREDAASHKWTVYVRGDKGDADVSAFVSKVRFFLHPSYRPNDVVEVTSCPFYLSRRGWGEFPVRVQLHFRNPLNKPMDIIHHLKLDRTYTGLQTLGSETLVDLWIHTAECRDRAAAAAGDDDDESCDNDGDPCPPVRERPAKSAGTSEPRTGSRPNTRSAPEEIRVKEEETVVSGALTESESPMDSAPIDESRHVQVKIEPPDNEATPSSDSNALHLSADLAEPSLEELRFYIELEHDYSSKRYVNFDRRTVREGNMTIEHFPTSSELPCATSSLANSSSSTTIDDDDGRKKRDDGATQIVSHRCNGDIQSPGDRLQPPTVSSAFRRRSDDDRKTPLKADGSLRACESEDSEGNVSKIPGNTSPIKGAVAPTVSNGLCGAPDASLDRPSARDPAHLKPLEIHIPSTLLATNKRVLLVTNNGQIPLAASKLAVDGDVAKSNVPRRGTSILKKPAAATTTTTTTTATSDKEKRTTVLKLRDANGFLLNVNCNVPALKIVDTRDPQYNYISLSEGAVRNGVSSSADKQEESPCASGAAALSETRDEKASAQRARITLGKDKYKLQSKQEQYEAVVRSIENARITDTEAFVRFAARRLPIITRDAHDPEYRRLHPYACRSEEDFLAHNVGKQRALEWHRARTIRRHLRDAGTIPDDRLWSVREIMVWARLHGHTPSRGGVFGAKKTDDAARNGTTKKLPDSSASGAIVSTCAESIALQKWLRESRRRDPSDRRSTDNDRAEDVEIDVESVDGTVCGATTDRRGKNDENSGDDSAAVGSALIPLEFDESSIPLHNFVYDTAREIGIRIGPEEIVPGVMHCAAARAIMRVVECFVEDLMRSSLARAWERNDSNGCPRTITLDDVRNALASREEFDIFTNDGLGSGQQQQQQQQFSATN